MQPNGIQIAFASGYLAKLTSVSFAMERGSAETSTFDNVTYRSFEPRKITDPGSLTVSGEFAPLSSPPITAAAESVTLVWPDAGATQWAWTSGWMESFSIDANQGDDNILFTAVLKLNSGEAITP